MTNIQKLAAEGNKNHRTFAATVVGFRRFTVFYYLIELKIENFVVFITQNTSRRTGISSVRERVFERHIVNAVRNVARHIQRIYEQQLSLWNKGLYIVFIELFAVINMLNILMRSNHHSISRISRFDYDKIIFIVSIISP